MVASGGAPFEMAPLSTRKPGHIVRADRAGFEHSEPALLARESSKYERVFFGVELRIEIVSGRDRNKAGRDSQAALGIKRNDHGGIIPPAVTRVKA
jgi:hypothetical protein